MPIDCSIFFHSLLQERVLGIIDREHLEQAIRELAYRFLRFYSIYASMAVPLVLKTAFRRAVRHRFLSICRALSPPGRLGKFEGRSRWRALLQIIPL